MIIKSISGEHKEQRWKKIIIRQIIQDREIDRQRDRKKGTEVERERETDMIQSRKRKL